VGEIEQAIVIVRASERKSGIDRERKMEIKSNQKEFTLRQVHCQKTVSATFPKITSRHQQSAQVDGDKG
jgi:hypothetical protein